MYEGDAIEHSMITKSVERAKKKVVENNFAIRKRLLEYDDVMNQQRDVIYSKRRQALEGERLIDEVYNDLDEYVDSLLDQYYENAMIDALHEDLLQHLLVEVKLDPETYQDLGRDGVKDVITKAAHEFYKRKEGMLTPEIMGRLERFAVLHVIDEKWKDHLREMDDLKEGIGLRAYGQKDPLLEYKGEAYKLFVTLMEEIKNEIVSFCFKFFPQEPEEIKEQRKSPQRMRMVKDNDTNLGLQGGGQQDEGARRGKQQPVVAEVKVGRNDPCPCGSGKKYKHCHGKN